MGRVCGVKAESCSFDKSSLHATISVDENNMIVSWDEAAEGILGYSGDEVVGKSLDIIIPEKYRGSHREGMKRFLETGVLGFIGVPVEFEALRKDGSLVSVELLLSAVKLEDSYSFSCVIRDLSGCREAEEVLLEEKQRLDAILGGVNCGFFLLDSQVRVTYANRVAEEWFGSFDEIKGKSPWKIFKLKDTEKDCAACEAVRTGHTVRGDLSVKGVNGDDKFFYAVASPFRFG